MTSNWHGLYINLHHRTDRNEHMKKFLAKDINSNFLDVKRFEACKSKRGALGCSLSHKTVLETLQVRFPDDKFYFVFEDDFWVLPDKERVWENFLSSFEIIKDLDSWDVILLTPRRLHLQFLPGSHEMAMFGFQRVYFAHTTTAYIIKSRYVDEYCTKLEAGIRVLSTASDEEYPNLVPQNAADTVWFDLQRADNFYAFEEVFAAQLPGFSDIENCSVDYTTTHFLC